MHSAVRYDAMGEGGGVGWGVAQNNKRATANVHGLVDKDVGRAVGRGDEAKALGAVKPLDRALLGAAAGRCAYVHN